nr:acetyl-coA carboxylase beta subunit [Helanthium bolivianum]
MQKRVLVSTKGLECKWKLNKSIYSFIGQTSENEVLIRIRNHTDKNISCRNDSGSCRSSNVEHIFNIKAIWSLISDNTFSIIDSNGHSYFIYSDIENQILKIDNGSSFLNELESFFSKYDTQSGWKYHINSHIVDYLGFQISMDISGGTVNYDESSISNWICNQSRNLSMAASANRNHFNIRVRSNDLDTNDQDTNDHDTNDQDTNDHDTNQKYGHLWVLCENCYELTYKQFLKFKMSICEHCGYHFKMNSSDRIELLVDPGTWDPINEDMVSTDPIEFYSENKKESDSKGRGSYPPDEEFDIEWDPSDIELDPSEWDPSDIELDRSEWDPSDIELDPSDIELDPSDIELDPSDIEDEEFYMDRINSSQSKTGLTEAVQTGIGQLNGIPIAIGVMDFEFMGGSMGSVVGEKITRLIEYASNRSLPLIIVCASGGARMQEGSLSLMQMAKISSALYNYQLNKKLFYVPILTSPTTGGVTASFGMLGDVIIAEPDALIAFAGKRVIEQTLKKEIPDGCQVSEYLFPKGLFDLMVPRNLLKGVLSELFQLHGFLPLNPNSKN